MCISATISPSVIIYQIKLLMGQFIISLFDYGIDFLW